MDSQTTTFTQNQRKWLSHLIVGCKYSLHKAKQVVDSYFVSRAEHQEFLGSFDRDHLIEATKTGAMSVFPKLSPDGYRIVCTKTRQTVDEKFDALCFCRANLAVLDLLLEKEPMHGIIYLYDLQYLRWSQFLVVTPTMTKNILSCCLNSFPVRIGGVHFVNPPKFISSLVGFFKMFVSAKIKDRIFIHDSLEEFYQYIPKDVLPDIYGGTAGTMEKLEKDLFEYLLSETEYLENRPIADLSKRPGQQNANNFGVEGTFKKLQID
ncbi:Hypothetical protein CINCED_3A001403 [Cinara cedri]|uniref:CRAL-TRIO domain-containing protein n=1 Tax=Cinara cedri TaxID=506608 RepID=A0A5E4NDR5_9HEMI|nr:Hypothetical protein CINCED_3A001403 [Cinara cedri]